MQALGGAKAWTVEDESESKGAVFTVKGGTWFFRRRWRKQYKGKADEQSTNQVPIRLKVTNFGLANVR